jgi:hypothetical protein
VDTNWYTDMGATDHITGELERLDVRHKYNGNDQVHMASGSGLNISHIGHSIISTLVEILFLRISCMFLKLLRIYYLLINLLLIIMPHSNTFQIPSW